MAQLGLGGDFAKYCGELDRKLTEAVKLIQKCDLPEVADLRRYFTKIAGGVELRDKQLQKARVAFLVNLDRSWEALVAATSESLVSDIQGRLAQVTLALRQVNVIVLPGGALEHYLPSYTGDFYELTDVAKRAAVERETALLASGTDRT